MERMGPGDGGGSVKERRSLSEVQERLLQAGKA